MLLSEESKRENPAAKPSEAKEGESAAPPKDEKTLTIDIDTITRFVDIKVALDMKVDTQSLPVSFASRKQYSQLFIESMVSEMLLSIKGEIKRLTKGLNDSPSKLATSSGVPSPLLLSKILKVNVVVRCHRITSANAGSFVRPGKSGDANDYYLKFVDAVPDSVKKGMMIDDIWLLVDSRSPADTLAKIGAAEDLTSLILCKTNWHCLSAQNMLNVSFMSKPVGRSIGGKQHFLKSVYAINLVNISTYVQVIENLIAFARKQQEMPVYSRINDILHVSEAEEVERKRPKQLITSLERDYVLEKAHRICDEFALNEDQRTYAIPWRMEWVESCTSAPSGSTRAQTPKIPATRCWSTVPSAAVRARDDPGSCREDVPHRGHDHLRLRAARGA